MVAKGESVNVEACHRRRIRKRGALRRHRRTRGRRVRPDDREGRRGHGRGQHQVHRGRDALCLWRRRGLASLTEEPERPAPRRHRFRGIYRREVRCRPAGLQWRPTLVTGAGKADRREPGCDAMAWRAWRQVRADLLPPEF